jgi:predicted nucleic acid-binding protein
MSNNPSVEDTIVLNTSPLIVLFKAELEFVLPEVFKRIVVPEAVWQEVSVYADEAFKGLSKATWLSREEISIDNRVVVWNLGNGESQVLSWALKKPDHIAVIDDLAARRCAESLSIRYIGTAGLLVLASRQKLLSSLAGALSQVRKAGLYLTDDFVERLTLEDKKDL